MMARMRRWIGHRRSVAALLAVLPALLTAGYAAAMMAPAEQAEGAAGVWGVATRAGLAAGLVVFLPAAGLSLVAAMARPAALIAAAALACLAALAAGASVGGDPAQLLGPAWLFDAAACVAAILLAGAVHAALPSRGAGGAVRFLLLAAAVLAIVHAGLAADGAPTPVLVGPAGPAGPAAFPAGLGAFAVLQLWLLRSRSGLVLRAARENRAMTEALGYRVPPLTAAMVVLAILLAAAGGALPALAEDADGLAARMLAGLLVPAFVAAAIGGGGGLAGTLLGAVITGLTLSYAPLVAPGAALPALAGVAALCLALGWLAPRPAMRAGAQA